MPGSSFEDFAKAAPEVVAGLRAASKAVADGGLEKELTELIKLRASQINGCAFCVQFHLNLARGLGVPNEKLDLVAAWSEAGIFTDRELAALAFTEALTDLKSPMDVSRAYATVLEHFSEREATLLSVAIGTINNWNRIAIALHFPPPIPPHR